ncbi:MAG: hypothetical protein GTO61_13270 [Gemmatimonadales bacterium]|nr:hypothetical protein [Gemmatimonadales bacterium]
MEPYTLVVSNPPHGQVNAAKAAQCLGLPPVDVNVKSHYPVPEIWLAHTNQEKMEAAAATLRGAGLNVAAIPGEDLLRVPPRTLAKSFAFHDVHFSAQLEDAAEVLGYDVSMIAVFCTLREQDAVRTSRASRARLSEAEEGLAPGAQVPSVEEILETSPFLDIYAPRVDRLLRLAIVPELVDFSGLGELAGPSAVGNLRHLEEEIEKRFRNARIDRRLMNMQLRQRHTAGLAHADKRRGYSYGSFGLLKLLKAVSPHLADLGHLELSSRLAYLTAR